MSVTCLECDLDFEEITTSHLRSHGIDLWDYKKKYPEAVTVDPKLAAQRNRNHSESMRGRAVGDNEKRRETVRRVWEIPGYRTSLAIKASNAALEVWKRPGYTEEMSQIHLEMWKNPSYAGSQTRACKDNAWPESARIKAREILEKLWQDQTWVESRADYNPYSEPSLYGWDWPITRLGIYKRDNYTCQKCDRKDFTKKNPISCHHINYNKEITEETNLITLCRNCNFEVNHNREYWQDFFIQKIQEIYSEDLNGSSVSRG